MECKKHKCKLIKETFTDGNIEEEDSVCPQCIEEFNEIESLKQEWKYINK